MNAIFGVTDKRINSTKQTFTQQKTLDVKLKEDCSMRSPVFKVKGLTKGTLYNYVQWENRYYYIQDIIYKTFDIQEVHCSLDTLATFKSSILAAGHPYWVLYTSKIDYWDKECDDPRFQPQVESNSLSGTIVASGVIPDIDVSGSGVMQEGTIILRNMDTHDGGVMTIAMPANQFFECLADITGTISGQSIVAALGSLGGSSWRDNILSCIWLPYKYSAYGSQTNTGFWLGEIPCGANVPTTYISPNQMHYDDWDADLTTFWADLDAKGPYLKNNRWLTLILDTNIGSIEIPTDYVRDLPKIYGRTIRNMTTGDVVIKISEQAHGLGVCLGTLSGNLAVDMLGMVGTGATTLGFTSNLIKTGFKTGLSLYSMGTSIGAFRTMRNLSQIMPMLPYLPNSGQIISNIQDKYDRTSMATSVVGTGISGMSSLEGSASGGGSVGSVGGLCGLYTIDTPGKAQLVYKTLVPSTAIVGAGYYQFYCTKYGFPTNKSLGLASLEGEYVQCSGASFKPDSNFKGNADDVSSINSFLNSGVYLE